MAAITWKRNDLGGVSSVDGRFVISPNYRHTVRPDSWELTDTLRGKRTMFNDKQRDAKELAETTLLAEAEFVGSWGFEKPDPQYDAHVVRWNYKGRP